MKQTFNIPAGCTVDSIDQDGDKVDKEALKAHLKAFFDKYQKQ